MFTILTHIRNIKGNLRRAFQRAFYGIDECIRNGWGLEYQFEFIIPEIKKFCERYLKDIPEKELHDKKQFNYNRYQVLLKTLELIKEWEECDDFKQIPLKEQIKKGELFELELIKEKDYLFNELVKYIANNMGYYWD